MAGKVRSSKIAAKYSGFWTIYIFVFSWIIFLSGCENQQQITFGDNVTPEQKKVELKRRLERRPGDYEVHFLLAQLYHAERNFDDAEFYYNRSLQFAPVYRLRKPEW